MARLGGLSAATETTRLSAATLGRRVTALERQAAKPPEPRLESDPRAGGNDVLAAGREVIEHYGWVDRDAGLARIPVDRGMLLLAQRGWPSRAEPEPGETMPPREQQARGRAQP